MRSCSESWTREASPYASIWRSSMPTFRRAFTVNAVTVEDIRNYRGKDRYTVTLIVDEEETEIVGEEDDEADDTEYVSEGGEDSQSIIGAMRMLPRSGRSCTLRRLPTPRCLRRSPSRGRRCRRFAGDGIRRQRRSDSAAAGRTDRAAGTSVTQPEGVADACREEIAAQSEGLPQKSCRTRLPSCRKAPQKQTASCRPTATSHRSSDRYGRGGLGARPALLHGLAGVSYTR